MAQTVGATLPAGTRRHVAAGASAAAQARVIDDLYQQRDRFIPVSRQALMTALAAPELWPGFDAAAVRTCFQCMAHWRHLSYADREQELIEAYLPFNPDRDISDTAIPAGAYDGRMKAQFLDAVRKMLERANYDEIPRESLQAVVDEFNPYGLELDVNLGEFEDIILFVRGEGSEDVQPDFVSKLRGKKPITVAVFHRIFLLLTLKPVEVRVKEVMIEQRASESKARKIVAKQRKMLPEDVDDKHIYVKMFKDVPRPDIEIMFPNTRVKLAASDKFTIGASAGGGIGMGVISTATKLVAAALSPLGAVLAIVGLAGAASQQVARVMHRRARYTLKVTRNLYFSNISNNQGAIALLTERAEEEDIKEELLLYTLLAKTSVHRSELPEAQTAIEGFLQEKFRVDVDFDTEDALERLLAGGLVVEHADGTLLAMSPATASAHIASLWNGYLDRVTTADQRPAPVESGAG